MDSLILCIISLMYCSISYLVIWRVENIMFQVENNIKNTILSAKESIKVSTIRPIIKKKSESVAIKKTNAPKTNNATTKESQKSIT